MTTSIVLNTIPLNCEIRGNSLWVAWTETGTDISPIIKASWTLEQEAVRLVKEEMGKE